MSSITVRSIRGVPQFPRMRALTLADGPLIRAMTQRYAPYSDFDFTSLWSWDTDGTVRIASLHDNLVVRFADYATGELFYSFLGDTNVLATAEALVRHAENEGLRADLRLVPETVGKALVLAGIEVQADEANHDYVLSLERLATYRGNRLGAKRNFVNRFLEAHEASAVVLDLADAATASDVLALFDAWTEEKGADADEVAHERAAVERLLSGAHVLPELVAVGVLVGGKLVAFSIAEVLHDGYSVIHFQKALGQTYVGVNAYLMRECARVLLERGCSLVNYEQDLGIPGLRQAKKSFDPVARLEKYVVRAEAVVGVPAVAMAV